MTLIINNDDVAALLTMEDTIGALEESYRNLASHEAICRPRIDIQIPTSNPDKIYQWGTMEGGSTSGYFAIRFKSDIIYEQKSGEVVTQEKYCLRPGLYCGLILLTDIESGEPLAFINDGVLQHLRVGADGGIGVKYMAKQDAEVVGMLGSGGMARSHMDAFMSVRPSIKLLKVFSPTRANCERFAAEMSEKFGIQAIPCEEPDQIYRDADIVARLTDSALPVTDGRLLEKGCHVLNVGGTGSRFDEASRGRIDVYLRFGNTPAPWGFPELRFVDAYLTWAARPDYNANFQKKKPGQRGHGSELLDKVVYLDDVLKGRGGRTRPDQITYSDRGNVQGAQFYAVAGKVYELAKAAGRGREIPTEWFLQNVRD
jgi:alanine dehydrogenase